MYLYLLNDSHPLGYTKASFFRKFGFSREAWQLLAWALRWHGQLNPVSVITPTDYGTLYGVDGPLVCPATDDDHRFEACGMSTPVGLRRAWSLRIL